MSIEMKIVWSDRRGREYTKRFDSVERAERRLAFLDDAEEQTRQAAPTDTGDVRFNYREEAASIRAILVPNWEVEHRDSLGDWGMDKVFARSRAEALQGVRDRGLVPLKIRPIR